jgi:hypothetical protein
MVGSVVSLGFPFGLDAIRNVRGWLAASPWLDPIALIADRVVTWIGGAPIRSIGLRVLNVT